MFSHAQYAVASERDRAIRDVSWAKQIGEFIDREYPGHYFRTDVDSRGGVLQLRHPLMPPHVFYVIKLKDLVSDPGFRSVKKAVGETLERINQRRGRRHEAEWDDYRRNNQRAINGMLTERNWVTGETRYRLPDEWQR